MANNEIQFILYTMPDGEGKVQVVVKNETLWCTQKAMSQLFGCSADNIGLHLKNIFNEGELNKDSVTEKISATASDGKFDYDSTSPTTREFFQMVQNRFHFAITGQTAPEIIYTHADHTKEHMGLTTWQKSPEGRILLSDTKVAKNYLSEKEIKQLERAVTGYFDYIEDLIERENAFSMEQFAASVNEFLTFRRYALLPDKGTIRREEADRKAEEEYSLFNPTQQISSDFDNYIKGLFENE